MSGRVLSWGLRRDEPGSQGERMCDCSEDVLVELPTIALFVAMEMGRINGFHEFDQAGSSRLGGRQKPR